MAFKPLDDAPAGSVSFRPLDDTEATTPTAADYLKGAASGVGGLVSGIGYLAEAAGANQLGGSIRGIGDTTQRYWQDSMTPAGQRAAQSQVFDDDPGSALPKLGDRWGQALAMGAAQSAPSMLAAAIPGGIAAAGLRGAAGMAASRGIGGALAPLAAGTAAPIGGWATNLAGNLAARVPTALGFGAAEGAVAGASNAAQWKSDIEQKPLAELRNMPGFAALEAQIGEQAARQQIAEQGAADIMARTALATGGIGALTGGGALGSAFQRVTTGAKGGILGAIGRDAAKEAGQEIPQSGGERAIQNIATRDYIDPSQSITQGVLADALSGGAIGGVMGGVTGGGSHLAKGPLQKAAEASAATTPPTTPLPDTQTAGIPAGTNGIPPGTIPGVHGTQQPAAGLAAAAQNTQQQSPAPGFVRYYHGGSPESVDGPLWFTSDLRDAEGWASRSPEMGIWYVDVPADHPSVAGDPVFGVLPPSRVELPKELAALRRKLQWRSEPVQNTPAAPGISPAPVSTAAPSLPTNQAEPAGVPVSQPQEGTVPRGNETEITKPAAPGQQAQPAKAADSAEAEREWRDFVASEGRDIGPRQLAVVRAQFMRRRMMNAGIEAATGRVEDARQREVAANRMAILEALPLTTTGNTIRRFAASLRDAGIRDSRVWPAERQLIARRIAARDTLQPLEQVPPNELALPEKQAKQAQPTMPRIDALRRRAATPGVRIVGNRMLDRHGKRLATLSDSEVSELLPKPQQQPVRTVEDTELADFIKSESADLGKRRVTLRALQALRQQKQAEADKIDLEDLIEAERADLRERFARLQDAQAAARAKKPFVIPPLTTPAQPTTTRVMEQKAADVPLGKHGKASAPASVREATTAQNQPQAAPEAAPEPKPADTKPAIPSDTGGDRKAEQAATAGLFPGASQEFLARIAKYEDGGEPVVIVRGAFVPDAEYTLYGKGYRLHLAKDWKGIQGEVSGSDPVRMAMRYRTEEDIVYASPAAKQQMADEAQAIAGQKAKDKAEYDAREANAKTAAEARERLTRAISSSGAKFTKGSFTAKSKDGGDLQDVQGLIHGGLIVHKSFGHFLRGPQQYTISHINLGISVLSGFKSQDAAKQAAVRLVMLADMGQLKTQDDIKKDAFRQVVRVGSAIKEAGGDPLAGAEIDFPADAIAEAPKAAEQEVKQDAKKAAVKAAPAPKNETVAQKAARLQAELAKLKPFDDGFHDALRAANAAISEHISAGFDAGEMPVYRVGDSGAFVTISPSTQSPGKIQVTRYNTSGVMGDSQYKTIEEAVKEESLAYRQRMTAAAAEEALGEAVKAEAEYQAKKSAAAKPEPAAPTEKPESSTDDMEKLQEARQLLADNIETKRLNRQTVPTAWTTKLAEVDAKIRGESDTEAVYSMVVEGHPMFDGSPMLRNLIPIKVTSLADAERKLFAAQDLYSKLSGDMAKAKNALSVAKTAQQKKAAQKALRDLNDNGVTEDAVDTLRQETLPELQRIVQAAEDKFGSAKPEPAPAATPTEPTSNAGELPAAEASTANTPASEPLENLEQLPARKATSDTSAAAKIDDFGEKLEGARKDYATQLKDAMDVDVASEPLSKSWPEPDYQKLLDGGADPYMVAFVRAARDELPTKPQKGWKLAGWVKQAEMLRDLAQKLLSGNTSASRVKEMLQEDRFKVVRDSVGNRAELYEIVGHGRSLKGVTFAHHFFSLYKGQENVSKWVVEQKAKATAFSNWPRELAVGNTKDEALKAFKEKFASLDLGSTAKRQPQFVVYRKRGDAGVWIGKKIGREYIDLHKTADLAEARKYMAENLSALEAKLARYKETPFERKPENQPRVGDDHRNGAPVTPDVFAETFGFRGVQFGNYVEQGRRQSDLNEAFDGLMDLAAVLGVPPRALSLNGRLGLAFGSRGRGGRNAPAAHFEPDRVVINLTKGGGPGSLAHEWWHSLDNYFAKQSNDKSAGFVTSGAATNSMRDALRASFNAVKLATSTDAYKRRSAELDKRRSKPYWNMPEERSARAFEGYVIAKLFDQGAANDYLANVVSNEAWDITEDARSEFFGGGESPKTYPYPTVDEMPVVRAAFDEFFKTVETKAGEDGNVVLYSGASSQAASPADRAIFSMAADGKPADEILSFISKASRRPFNRILAAALRRAGLASTITLDSASRFGKQQGAARYAAAYNARTDTVALFTYRDAERHVLHELVHAATMKAIAGKGPAAVRMRALFRHVQKSGRLDGQYGMTDVDEFVAEAFSNPRFQEALRGIPAPAGSALKSAWQWFVNIVARIVGIKMRPSETALDRALTVGAQLMRENAALAGGRWAGGEALYSADSQPFDVLRAYRDMSGRSKFSDFDSPPEFSATRKANSSALEVMQGKPPGKFSLRADGADGSSVTLDVALHDRITEEGAAYRDDLSSDRFPRGTGIATRMYLSALAVAQKYGVAWESDSVRSDENEAIYRRLIKNGVPFREVGGIYVAEAADLKATDLQAVADRIAAAMPTNDGAPFDGPEVAATPLKPGATTINVDGTERPALNSNGKPIHWSEEGVRNFWRWFGDSHITERAISSMTDKRTLRPRVLFHGTKKDLTEFAEFRDGNVEDTFERYTVKRIGVSLTENPQFATTFAKQAGGGRPNIIPLYAKITNPMYLEDGFKHSRNVDIRFEDDYVLKLKQHGFSRADDLPDTRPDALWNLFDGDIGRDFVKAAISAGYDGAVITEQGIGLEKDDSEQTTIVAFSPTQIKSATGNSGAFSPTDPDIRFNLATDWQQSPVAQEVSKAFSAAARSDAALSWLNPVQTQYHKAERLAQQGKFGFKRVFELGQRFLSDISRFAVMAENSAPTLFHQIRSIADAKQAAGAALRGDFGKQRNADIRAIAAPLYEGTLYGGGNPMAGMVWSDAQLRSRFGLTDRQIALYHEAREAVKVSMDEMAKSLIARHAKREKVAADTSGSLQDVAEGVRDTLTLRADVLADEAQAEHDDTMQQVQDLRDAGGQDKRAADMQKEAEAKLASQNAEVARIRATVSDVQAIADKAQKLQDAGYFPLMRFGRHTVTARDADGKVQHFSMHDGIPLVPRSGQAQANKLADALREEHPDWDVTTGLMNPEKYKLYQGMNVDALQLFADHLDDETKQTYQDIIRLATNERSALRRMLKREGTPGFDRDVRRTLASFILSNARYTSSAYHLADMARAAEQAEEDGGDVGAEAVKLYDYVTKPQEEAAKLRGFLFFNFLGGSIAAAMVNATQVPMMTFPRLAQYDDAGKLAARLARAAKMATGNPQDVAGEVGAALRRAEEDGITAPHQIYEMTATAANNIFAGSMGGSALLRAWGAPFAMAESFNRRTTFIAAWQIGQGMTANQLRDAGASTAFEFAEKMVQETQGIYNRGNRVNVGRGAIGSVVMTFKQFSVMYLEMFSRLPPRQKAIMAGMLILAAGAGGLPFAEDIEDIIDTVGQWLGYRTNTRRTIRRGLSAVAGQRAADIAMNGVLSQVGVDLHSRLGLHNILPGSALLKPSTTDKGREFQDLLGPAASVVAAMGQALQDLATGRPDKAALAMAPVAIQNAAKGIAMANTGRATDMRGKPTIPVSPLESLAKGVGFNPKSVADYGTIKRDSTQDDRLIDVTRERFTAAIVDAILADDQDARREALQDVVDWNKRNPDARIAINPAAIRRRVADMRAEGPARVLKSLSPSLRQQARQEFADAQ